MVWETDNKARQRWCTRLVQGGGLSSPLFDGFDNLYIGQPGAMLSFPPTQWIRWRQPVIGMPTTPRILAPGQLLVVTHLGQVLVFDTQKGTVVGTPLDLVGGVNRIDSTRGLADCQPMRPRCPVAAAPAFASATGIVVVSLWEPNAAAPGPGWASLPCRQSPLLTAEWSSDAVGQGRSPAPRCPPTGPPCTSIGPRRAPAGRSTPRTGNRKWSVPLNFLARTPPSVSPDGVIVAGGGPELLVAVRDGGDKGDVLWTRDDVVPLSSASRAGNGVGYTVAKDGENGQALLVFDPADGHTVNSYPLPQATGWPVGVSVGHDRRVVTATSDGQVYGFAPE
jgi:hypothetical protein